MLQPASDFFGIYAILKQKSKHNFAGELAERAGFFKKSRGSRRVCRYLKG
jgi:hypothetical protein